MFILTHILEI